MPSVAVSWLADRVQHKPLILGILNVTPDSFSDGGRFNSHEAAVESALQMHEAGADFIDIGAQSTRPGATEVSVQAELDRLLPIVEALASYKIPLSVDTYKTAVMQALLAYTNIAMINDINALQSEGALEAVAQAGWLVCLMHKQGTPDTMQHNPHYENVVEEVKLFLQIRAQAAMEAGIAKRHIILDPGFGFGKRLQDNVSLLRHLSELKTLGFPLLVGLSRKSMLGQLTGRGVGERLPAGIAATLFALMQGAHIIRTHDVPATQDTLFLYEALINDH